MYICQEVISKFSKSQTMAANSLDLTQNLYLTASQGALLHLYHSKKNQISWGDVPVNISTELYSFIIWKDKIYIAATITESPTCNVNTSFKAMLRISRLNILTGTGIQNLLV